MNLVATVLIVFGVASSTVLIAVGLLRAGTGRYRDRTGAVLEGWPAARAGLLVAAIGAGELAVTAVLYAAMR